MELMVESGMRADALSSLPHIVMGTTKIVSELHQFMDVHQQNAIRYDVIFPGEGVKSSFWTCLWT